MVKYLDKIYTFLMVYRECSFSKASKKLGISQPAVTQQIRILEEYLGVPLFQRKKNGVTLTKEGQEFLEIVKDFEKFLKEFEKKLEKFRDGDKPVLIGASPTLGNYFLPECIKYFKTLTDKDINLIIKSNDELYEDVFNDKLDLAFVTKYKDILEKIEWKKDELVVFSNKPLPSTIEAKDLLNYKLVCREKNSSTRDFIKKILSDKGLNCDNLNIVSVVHNATALKNIVLNSSEQVVSIISKTAIKDDLKSKKLFLAKIKGVDLHRQTYMIYKHLNKDIEAIISFIRS